MSLFTIKNVNFMNKITYPLIEIEEGKVTFIRGKSGTGKSTLLKTIENIATHLSVFLETKEPESLHQYRVSVRMARSVCLEFSEFMEEKRKFALEKILKSLQKETNEMRDIDVFLECIEAYKTHVEPSCLYELESLEAKLMLEKKEAYASFEKR